MFLHFYENAIVQYSRQTHVYFNVILFCCVQNSGVKTKVQIALTVIKYVIDAAWPAFLHISQHCKNYDFVPLPLPSRYRFLVIVTHRDPSFHHRDTPVPNRPSPSPPSFTVPHRPSPSLTVLHRPSPSNTVPRRPTPFKTTF